MNSVFPEWIGGAAPYVRGVSGTLSKKFNDFNEAWEHVEKHLSTVQRLTDKEEAAIGGTDVRMAGLSITPQPPTAGRGKSWVENKLCNGANLEFPRRKNAPNLTHHMVD
jgi:hypothetical protein